MIPDRKLFKWKVKIQAATGVVKEVFVEAYWSPNYEGVKEAVAHAACSRAWLEGKKATMFQALEPPVLVND